MAAPAERSMMAGCSITLLMLSLAAKKKLVFPKKKKKYDTLAKSWNCCDTDPICPDLHYSPALDLGGTEKQPNQQLCICVCACARWIANCWLQCHVENGTCGVGTGSVSFPLVWFSLPFSPTHFLLGICSDPVRVLCSLCLSHCLILCRWMSFLSACACFLHLFLAERFHLIHPKHPSTTFTFYLISTHFSFSMCFQFPTKKQIKSKWSDRLSLSLALSFSLSG